MCLAGVVAGVWGGAGRGLHSAVGVRQCARVRAPRPRLGLREERAIEVWH
eukprot:COSAG06_NODE_30846_length_531_cov_1.168981_1_plen_50_part_00